jgi:catechol 2,3-dioxygenase-like lactoylglutathione lyase family enzyme
MLGDSEMVTTIAVKDMDEAKKFYGDTLGLSFQSESPGGVAYKSGNGGVFVYPSQYAGTNQATYGSWTVNDIEAVVSDLEGKGVKFEQYDNMPGTVREGNIHVMGKFKMAWFRDPTGNILAVDNGEEM